MKLPLRLSFGCLLVMSFSATAKSYDFIQEHLEQAFSSSVVLSDSDVFTAGFNNFDPNDWFKTDNDNLGTPESIENRKKYKSSTLPITLALSEEEAYHQHQLFFRLSASVIDDELSIANMPGGNGALSSIGAGRGDILSLSISTNRSLDFDAGDWNASTLLPQHSDL